MAWRVAAATTWAPPLVNKGSSAGKLRQFFLGHHRPFGAGTVPIRVSVSVSCERLESQSLAGRRRLKII
jgi:hypothetical protein